LSYLLLLFPDCILGTYKYNLSPRTMVVLAVYRWRSAQQHQHWGICSMACVVSVS